MRSNNTQNLMVNNSMNFLSSDGSLEDDLESQNLPWAQGKARQDQNIMLQCNLTEIKRKTELSIIET